jgi:hypothetical protein
VRAAVRVPSVELAEDPRAAVAVACAPRVADLVQAREQVAGKRWIDAVLELELA